MLIDRITTSAIEAYYRCLCQREAAVSVQKALSTGNTDADSNVVHNMPAAAHSNRRHIEAVAGRSNRHHTGAAPMDSRRYLLSRPGR